MQTRAVVLSDLHLGAEECVLSEKAAREAGRPYEEHFERMLTGPIRERLAQTGHGTHPVDYLILNGDTLDFAVQSYENAFAAGRLFFQAMAAARPKLFGEIIYIPGNHDHNIWEMVQHQVCVMRRIERGDLPRAYPHVQLGVLALDSGGADLELPGVSADSAAPRGKYGDIFLKGLFGSGPAMPINVVYPDLLIRNAASGGSSILVTHGHFFCLPWVLMTEVFPRSLRVQDSLTLRELEEVNAPLTKLGWTSLGQAGKLTDVANLVWSGIKAGDTAALGGVLDELGHYLDENVFRYGRLNPLEWLTDVTMALVKRGALKAVKNMRADGHRYDKDFLRREENLRLVAKYCRLSRQAFSELPGIGGAASPGSVIFGHTDYPVPPGSPGSRVTIDGTDVAFANAGGWHAKHLAAPITVSEDGALGYVELAGGR